MFQFNDKNIELLECIINNAEFRVSDLPSVTEKGQVILNIRRPCWEKQEEKKLLFINRILVKEIYSRLVFEVIKEIHFKWKDDSLNELNDLHTIHHIRYDLRKKSITLDSGYIEVSFIFESSISISLENLKEPTNKTFITVIGRKGFKYESWKNAYDN